MEDGVLNAAGCVHRLGLWVCVCAYAAAVAADAVVLCERRLGASG
jgi:hypothetical protein